MLKKKLKFELNIYFKTATKCADSRDKQKKILQNLV